MSKVAPYELWSKGDFRVCAISRLVCIRGNPFDLVVEHVGHNEGLGIEHKVGVSEEGRPTYCVIAFVRPDKDGGCHYESVGSRIEDFCKDWDDILLFREAFEEASKTIAHALEDSHEHTDI